MRIPKKKKKGDTRENEIDRNKRTREMQYHIQRLAWLGHKLTYFTSEEGHDGQGRKWRFVKENDGNCKGCSRISLGWLWGMRDSWWLCGLWGSRVGIEKILLLILVLKLLQLGNTIAWVRLQNSIFMLAKLGKAVSPVVTKWNWVTFSNSMQLHFPASLAKQLIVLTTPKMYIVYSCLLLWYYGGDHNNTNYQTNNPFTITMLGVCEPNEKPTGK